MSDITSLALGTVLSAFGIILIVLAIRRQALAHFGMGTAFLGFGIFVFVARAIMPDGLQFLAGIAIGLVIIGAVYVVWDLPAR